jgi:hypothetical protein
MIRTQSLERALPAIVGFITDKIGIPVLRGLRACTTGSVIYVPKLPDLGLSMRDVVRVIAYIYHECFHVLWTNFKLNPGALPPLQQSIVRVLCDIRIENKGIGRFPAARKYLGQLVQIFTEDGLAGKSPGFPPFGEDASEAKLLQFYMLYKLRHDVLKQVAILPSLEPTEVATRAKFPKSMMVRLDALMFQVTGCDSTDDVFSLAEEIAVMIKEEKEKEEERKEEERKAQEQAKQDQQDQQQQQGDGSADPDDADGDGDDDSQQASGSKEAGGEDDGAGNQDADGQSASSDEGEQEDDANTSGDGTDDPSAVGNEEGDSQQASGQEGDGDEGSSDPTADADGAGGSGDLDELLSMGEEDLADTIDEMLEAVINETADELAGQGVSMPNIHKLNLKNGHVDLPGLRASINAVRTRTLQWMASQTETDVMHARQGVHLDFSRLHEAKRGGAIFLRSEEGIDLNAAVSFVIDRSGSMCSTIQHAARATVAAMMAFDVPGIETQVSVFPVYAAVGEDSCDEGVAVVKRWEESPRHLAGRIAGLDTSGGTPMAEAILFAASDICRRDETLKLICVVTDGDPNDEASTMEVIATARASGITVVGLGIGVDPSRVFGERYSATLLDIRELSGAMIKLIKSSMYH